jgi:hypothetical protein
MPYLVKATHSAGNRFRATLDTRRAAVLSARDLRRMGFEVAVTGPEGEMVDVDAPTPGAASTPPDCRHSP